jgi:hypothetical protein
LWADACGALCIQTDMSTSAMGKGDLARLGNNAVLAADPGRGTGPIKTPRAGRARRRS